MLLDRFFVNSETDETTHSKSKAMRWLRSGVDVEEWVFGHRHKVWMAPQSR